MEKNSFDVPAYKFGIVKPTSYIPNNISTEEAVCIFNTTIKSRDYAFIPFECVEGLTLEELNKVVGARAGMFTVCYTEWIDKISKKENINFKFYICHTKKDLVDNYDKTIDEYVGEIFHSKYDELKATDKRIARCFLQRYCYKSYEATKEKVKRLAE